MSTPPSGNEWVCDVIIGDRSFRLSSKKSLELQGWTYSVLDVNIGKYVLPQSPISSMESGKRCAERFIREHFAFSHIDFEWKAES